ncbi:MAG: hypothetical protein ACOH1N_14155 [Lutibacter sp.]
MKKVDIPRIAAVLNAIYDNSKGKMVSVSEKPLTPCFDNVKIYSDDRVKIMDYLKDRLLWHEGYRAGLKYMWKGDMPDTAKIAEDIVDYYSNKENLDPKFVKTVKKEVVDVVKRDLNIARPPERIVGSRGYSFYEHRIHESYICSVTKIPNQRTSFDVLISDGNQNVRLTDVPTFPTLKMLAVYLEKTFIKFKPDLPIRKEAETIVSNMHILDNVNSNNISEKIISVP